jgi:DNA-directed RNA polymerase subunit M/transcription elongation factor TFIIS
MHGLLAFYRQEAEALKIAKVQTSAFVKPLTGPDTERCPACGSAAVVVAGQQLVGDEMRETKRCGQCGKQWAAG